MRPFRPFRLFSLFSLFSLLLLLVFLLVAPAFCAEPDPADITCSQGEDCDREIVFTIGGLPVNLTGYTFRAQIRATPTDATPLVEIPIDSSAQAEGQITLQLPASATTQLAGKSAVWDLKQTEPSGLVSYPMRGKFKCLWSVTR